MKGAVVLIFVAVLIGVLHGHQHGHHHGHQHGHHGHQHGHHGHQHGHHGHQHGHHGHHHEEDDVDERGHYVDERQAAKFRYSKQANEEDEPVAKHQEPKIGKDHGHSHGHEEDHDHSHGHEEDGKEEGHDHSHGKEEGHGHSHGKEEEGHGHSHGHEEGHGHTHGSDHSNKKGPVSWMEPLLATALISAAPFLILFVVPLNNSPESRPLLKVLLSFASGGLLGDAFLHLIPHAISPHIHGEDGDHSHGHSHSHGHTDEEVAHDHSGETIVGLWVLGGIIAFLVIEKFMRFLRGGHGHSHGDHSHGDIKTNGEVKKSEESNGDVKTDEDKEHVNGDVKKEESEKDTSVSDGEGLDEDKDPNCDLKKDDKKEDPSAEPNVKVFKPVQEEEEIKVAAYLNLAADCTHNFTDGLAIGASFLVSRNVGFITTLTIFLHEIPHEIGDFAILVQSGCTKRKAMLLQLVTAIGAFAGCICGLFAGGLGTAASAWILPFTAGGFIYIATVSVIPELLVESDVKQSIKEILGLLVGVFLMVIIASME